MTANDGRGRVLFVDDDEGVLVAAELLLKREVDLIRTLSFPERIPQVLGEESFDAIFLDMNFTGGTTSGSEGFHWLQTILEIDAKSVVILMTAYGDVEMAVRAIKRGATDFILKPWRNEKMIAAVENAVARGRVRKSPGTQNTSPIEDRQRQFEQELAYAADVQRRLLPQEPPSLSSLEYHAVCRPARGVGGDYYDFIDIGHDRLGMALGDVSGKGVSAALLMASLQGCLQSYASQHGESVDALLEAVNRLIATSTDTARFITFFYGVYDDYRRRLTYVNAGHLPPLLLRRGFTEQTAGRPERLETGGTVIGIFAQAHYQKETIQLYSGDILVLFTDGISEAMNENEEEFGEERLLLALRRNQHLPAVDLVEAVLKEVEDYSGHALMRDDLTLMVAKIR